MKIYTASKTKHAEKWRALRGLGFPVISTWIDEAGEGQTGDWADLWTRCVGEAAAADCTIVYCEEGDRLKGGLVEVGAALANGKRVYAVGPMDGSWVRHPLVTTCNSVSHALEMIGGNQ